MTYYMPFGKNCMPAYALKYSGLRVNSLPFDWVAGEAHLLKQSLDNRFVDWFDQSKIEVISELVTVEESEGLKKATVHRDYFVPESVIPNGAFFAHMDLSDPSILAKLKRRVELFYRIIDSDETIVLVTSASYEEFRDNGLLDYFDREASTHVIFIDWIEHSENIAITQSDINGYVHLGFSAPFAFEERAMLSVGNHIKSLNL